MNDLNALSQVRDDLPPPDTDVLAGARTMLTDRIGEPAVVTPSRRRVPVRRQAWLVAAAAAVVATGAIALTPGSDSAKHRAATGTHTTAATRPIAKAPALTPAGYLLDAAKHTRAGGDPVVPAGQYRYVRTHAWFGNTIGTARAAVPPAGPHTARRLTSADAITFLSEQQYEEWVPADGTGTWYWRYTRPIDTKFFSAADRAYVEKNFPRLLVRGVENYTGADGQIGTPVPTTWGAPTPAWLAALPRDPDALLAKLSVDVNKGGADIDGYDRAFMNIAQVLSSGLVPADLRAAFYTVATRIPGIVLVDPEANLDGQQGVAIGRINNADGTRQDIIFDSAGGRFIGEREVIVRADDALNVPVGTEIESTAITVGVAAKPPAG